MGAKFFRTRPDRPWGPPSLLYSGYRIFPGGKAAGAWCYSPHLVPRLKKEQSYTSTPLTVFVPCSRVNFSFSLLFLLVAPNASEDAVMSLIGSSMAAHFGDSSNIL